MGSDLGDGVVVGGGNPPLVASYSIATHRTRAATATNLMALGQVAPFGYQILDPAGISPRKSARLTASLGERIEIPNTWTIIALYEDQNSDANLKLYGYDAGGNERFLGMIVLNRPALVFGGYGQFFLISGYDNTEYYKIPLFEEAEQYE